MSLSEAAKWAGVARPTIHKALVRGRLAGQKNEAGQWRIDPSELARLYPPAKSADITADRTMSSRSIDEAIAARDREIALLREILGKAEAREVDLRAERDRLLDIVEAALRSVRGGGAG